MFSRTTTFAGMNVIVRSRSHEAFWPGGLPSCSATKNSGSANPKLAEALAEAEWIVDALLGTGLSRPVEGVMLKVIEAMNAAGRPILALDLPSGLDADTGKPLGAAVRAFATATFVAPKLGFAAHGSAQYTGLVAVIDIGLPRCVLEPYFA